MAHAGTATREMGLLTLGDSAVAWKEFIVEFRTRKAWRLLIFNLIVICKCTIAVYFEHNKGCPSFHCCGRLPIPSLPNKQCQWLFRAGC